MKARTPPLLLVFAATLLYSGGAMAAAPAVVPAVEKGDEYSGAKAAPAALPKEFAFVFSLPYGIGDEFPREPDKLDQD
jgi:hypothetical protein